ncbi:STAS domain-containing protein [Streptomyces sp. NPDC093261]|uniref:STAS domain-containing protein n=1 Tax=Streptomyces sp. NPDC093261 TaxID=3366037 RepID=UPI003800F06B
MTSVCGGRLPSVDATTPAVLYLTALPVRDEVAALCEDVRALLEGTGAAVVVCDVAALRPVTLAAVDALARLQLAARRAGGRIRLRDPAPALRALLELAALPIELEGQAEQWEPALGVEEAVEPGDPAL